MNQAFLAVRQHIMRGEIDKAYALNSEYLAKSPGDVMLLVQRSRIEIIRDRYREAQRATSMAADAFLANPVADGSFEHVLKRLHLFGLEKQIATLLRSPDVLAMMKVDDLSMACFIAGVSNLTDESLMFADRLCTQHKGNLKGQVTAAQAMVFAGKLDDAKVVLESALHANPLDPLGWLLLSKLSDKSEAAAVGDRVTALLPRFPVQSRENGYMNYARHFAYDKSGRIDEAAKSLEQGMRSFRAITKYSIAEDRALFAKLKQLPVAQIPPAEADAYTPIFVLGMHRSGTTLTEQLLAGNPAVQACGELNDLPHALRYATDHFTPLSIDEFIVDRIDAMDPALVREEYFRNRASDMQPGKRVFTDKLPQNALNIEVILRCIPNARIVLLQRDPREVGFSNLREIFSEGTGRYTNDQLEMAEYLRLHDDYMQHLLRRYPASIFPLNYQELVEDPEVQMRRVAAFCGLEWDPAMASTANRQRSVSTASAIQVRSEVQSGKSGRQAKWRKYESWLQPMLDGLDQN